MAEGEEKRETSPKDLLQTLLFSTLPRKIEESTEGKESIELSLGLSLNGRFGVDPKREEILSRSSSVADFAFTNEHSNGACVDPPLIRTCSLPMESEEDCRKRKDIQSLRRMEAKKKRIDKMRNQGIVESNSGENLKSQTRLEGLIPPLPLSQGSIGSRGSGSSSAISESGSQPIQGMNGYTEARSPASIPTLPKQSDQKAGFAPTEKSAEFVGAATENSSLKVSVSNGDASEIMRNMLVDMPCVSTRGIGSNGKRVEGFLYRYRKGEEVRIVCVCHGSFLSPAEFIKHAGGGDVAHPLKHIVVNPSPLL